MKLFRKLKNSFSYAIDGFKLSFKYEPNMKIHVTIAFIVMFLGLVFRISNLEWIILIFSIGLVLSGELLNTAIEYLVDLASKELNWDAKCAKDTSAAYVMVLSLTAATIGLIVFIPKIISMIKEIL